MCFKCYNKELMNFWCEGFIIYVLVRYVFLEVIISDL